MKTLRQFLIEEKLYGHSSLVDEWHKTLSSKEHEKYAKRGNCGWASYTFKKWAKEKKGVELNYVRGHFATDKIVSERKDLSKDMKKELRNNGKDINNSEHRHNYIKNHPIAQKHYHMIPHEWTTDQHGTIHDPSGHGQFVKAGLASDLNPKRYTTKYKSPIPGTR